MRITLSGAMRARDVSRPSDEQLAAAAKREESAVRPGAAPMIPAPPIAPADPAPTAPAQPGSEPAPRRRRRRRG
jgi:hypothetical protein